MQCVKAGGDRQILHEAIREHSMAGNIEHPNHPIINHHLVTTFFLIFILFCFLVFIYVAGRKVKEEGAANDLLDRIAADALFAAVHSSLHSLLDPSLFVGRSPEQVREFLEDCIDPILTTHASELAKKDVDAVNV